STKFLGQPNDLIPIRIIYSVVSFHNMAYSIQRKAYMVNHFSNLKFKAKNAKP
ncbi:unnamed protein product, partial [marine sediment metagenome]